MYANALVAESKAAQQLSSHFCEFTIGQTEHKEGLDDASCGTASDMWNKLKERRYQHLMTGSTKSFQSRI